MTVVFDNSGVTVTTGAAVTTLSDSKLTIASGFKMCVVYGVYFNGISSFPGGVGATWDSGGTNQSMNLLQSLGSTSGTSGLVAIYGLLNPTPGNKTFTITGWAGTENVIIYGASFSGVSAVGNNGSGTRNTSANTATTCNACTSTIFDAVFGFATSQTDNTSWTGVNGSTLAQGGGTSVGAAYANYSIGSSPSFTSSGTANSAVFWQGVAVSLSGFPDPAPAQQRQAIYLTMDDT